MKSSAVMTEAVGTWSSEDPKIHWLETVEVLFLEESITFLLPGVHSDEVVGFLLE